ncbi:MAG: exonuclease SbcCD subunit D [Bacteroides sp.]|nr:exonuclease SbcCD subunit D [Bacteroides sp.]
MKFIHTSDWHLGQQLYYYDRTDEHRHFIDTLVDMIREECPDALLVAGDIYDSHTPSLASQRLFESAMERLMEADERLEVFLITGNHDSSSKVTLFRHLINPRIHIVGMEPEIFVRDDSVIGCVPYMPEFNYRPHIPEQLRDKAISPMADFYRYFVGRMRELASDKGKPLILMSHIALSNADYQGHSGRNFQFYDAESIPAGIAYHALGHIHFPQTIMKEGMAGITRYSGSPLPLSFDESYAHSVTVVTLTDASSISEMRVIPLEPLRKVITIPVDREAFELDEVDSEADKFLKEHSRSARECYLRIKVSTPGSVPESVNLRMRQLFNGTGVRYCVMQGVAKPTEAGGLSPLHSSGNYTVDELQDIDPLMIVERHFSQRNRELSDELRQLLGSILNDD